MKRDRWVSRSVFILAAIASAIGLGNLWRFPYLCYEHGGGAFLIPYFIALLTAGLPLMILEFGLGRYTGASAPLAFSKIKSKFEWLGWFALCCGFVVVCYYVVVMAWCLCYIFFSVNLAWQIPNEKTFFYEAFLRITKGPHYIEGINLLILSALLVCWGIIFWTVYRGIKFIGIVGRITVIVPVLLLVIFVIRGLTLPDSVNGLNYYLAPNFSKLKDPAAWLAAYSQVFFSLSIAFGIMIAYASYLPEGSDVNNNASICSFSDSGFSFLGGFAVFATLGYLAGLHGVKIEEIAGGAKSIGLAFITYPTVISQLPLGNFLGILFFSLLLLLALGSAISLVEAVVSGFMDKFKIPREITASLCCLLAFAFGIIFTTGGGLYWLDIIDFFITHFGLPTVALLQCIVIGYIFGAKKFRSIVNGYSDFKIGKWWDVCICLITPFVLSLFLISSILKLTKEGGYGGYPLWSVSVGICVVVGVLILSFILMYKRAKRA